MIRFLRKLRVIFFFAWQVLRVAWVRRGEVIVITYDTPESEVRTYSYGTLEHLVLAAEGYAKLHKEATVWTPEDDAAFERWMDGLR